jgi:hypothetical protein
MSLLHVTTIVVTIIWHRVVYPMLEFVSYEPGPQVLISFYMRVHFCFDVPTLLASPMFLFWSALHNSVDSTRNAWQCSVEVNTTNATLLADSAMQIPFWESSTARKLLKLQPCLVVCCLNMWMCRTVTLPAVLYGLILGMYIESEQIVLLATCCMLVCSLTAKVEAICFSETSVFPRLYGSISQKPPMWVPELRQL